MPMFSGSPPLPSGLVLALMSVFAVGGTCVAFWMGDLSTARSVGLFLTLEGMALLISAFSPTGWIPFQGGSVIDFLTWLRGPNGGDGNRLSGPVHADLLLLYSGFLVSVTGAVIMSVAH